MGGTVPSIRPPNAALSSAPWLGFFCLLGSGRGEETPAGGVCALTCGDSGAGAGGVGTGGVD